MNTSHIPAFTLEHYHILSEYYLERNIWCRTKINHALCKCHYNKICITINVNSGTIQSMGQAIIVCIATHYRLHSPGIESRWRVRLSAPIQNGPWANPVSYTRGIRSFLNVKQQEHGTDHPPPSSAKVKEREEL
jgi:hypothetical protein